MQAEVRAWKEMLKPILEAENKRPVFDMRRVIDQIDEALENSDPTTWKHLVRVTVDDDFDLPRVFTATLQMANEGKVI